MCVLVALRRGDALHETGVAACRRAHAQTAYNVSHIRRCSPRVLARPTGTGVNLRPISVDINSMNNCCGDIYSSEVTNK